MLSYVCLGGLGVSIIPGGNERDERLKYLKRKHIADYHKEDDDDLEIERLLEDVVGDVF